MLFGSRPAHQLACLGATLALAVGLLAGCGSGGDSDAEDTAAGRPAPAKSEFPPTGGRTLSQIVEASAESRLVVSPAAAVFHRGPNRFPFGVFETDHTQVADADVALYVARAPRNDGAPEEPALGPFPAAVESIATQPAFRAKTTSDDPDAATVVYSSEVDFPEDGEWRILAAIKEGDGIATTVVSSAAVGRFDSIPRPGERAPRVRTPTRDEVADLGEITTRIPPDTQNEVDFADVYGKQPVILLFATPQFCQSRVCGPVVDVAEQVKQLRGDEAAFVHMEIFEDNEPPETRPQVQAFEIETEPWLFAIDRDGRVVESLEGAFGVEALEAALDKATRG